MEIIFDMGIGEIFNVRIVGNIFNDDLLGSLEFVCVVVGVKVILVMGYIVCGVIKGVIDNVEFGNLIGFFNKIKFVIDLI